MDRGHYAIIGMATVASDYPLYYEATNEKGLSMAGLNFPENADYKPFNKLPFASPMYQYSMTDPKNLSKQCPENPELPLDFPAVWRYNKRIRIHVPENI